jgi:LuxR family maltose regulon positive regulatory protein
MREPHYYSGRLKQKLEKLRFAPVAIVEAPSGYGKTTALLDFFEASPSVYWFTAAEEAPAAAFRRLCREIEKIDGNAGQKLLRIEMLNTFTIGEAMDILRSIRCSHEAYLVIDNFHILENLLPPAFITAIFEHGGENLHIIIVSQMLKRDILTFITGRGYLYIGTSDLRLSSGDIRCYYALAGVNITAEEAKEVERYTEGWIIAVFLQLCAFRETGRPSDTVGILTLMERLVWDALSAEQKTFLLYLSPFEMVTVQQACDLIGCSILPEYAMDALSCPFIRYEPAERKYVLHSVLAELLIQKRRESGAALERECLLRAGDFCRDNHRTAEAMGFYARIKDYDRMLSLDLSGMALETIDNAPYGELACDIARNCPEDIKERHILSMLHIAWALLVSGMRPQYEGLMDELYEMSELQEDPDLLGEWMLLSTYRSFPDIIKMTAALKQAVPLFKGGCSRVILPASPWCFGSYYPLAEFHTTPGEADREAGILEEYITLYSRLTGGHCSGTDVLFRAELAYQRGNINEAEIFAYKAAFLAESSRQSMVQLGATMLLASIALHKADTMGWQHAINSMERALSYPSQNTFFVRSMLDIVRGVLLCELKHHADIAGWLQKGEFPEPLTDNPMFGDALFVYMNYLMHRGEYARLIGVMQAASPKAQWINPFQKLITSLVEAAGYVQIGDREKAASLVERAAESGLPDGLIFLLASYSWILDGLPDELLKEKFPEHLDEFNKVKERFSRGWDKLYKDMLQEEFPPGLTPREYEVAKLASQGMRNSEIAEELMVTESTVRTHLRTAFQKLDIDRRARLAEKLK